MGRWRAALGMAMVIASPALASPAPMSLLLPSVLPQLRRTVLLWTRMIRRP